MKETAEKTIGEKQTPGFNVEKIRQDFPILDQRVNGFPLAYLDNAATSQKPRQVIDAVSGYYQKINSNVHRGAHFLSTEATDAYEHSRANVGRFLNARHSREINFVRGTTEGINLVAYSYGRNFIGKGDEILISAMEHHANIVPWQMVCQSTGASLKVIPVTDTGDIDLGHFDRLLNARTKLVSIVHTSNSLGTINPIEEIIEKAHAAGAKVLVDGAQAVPHQKVDVQSMDCDFFCFSGHKLFAPTGIGVLYGKETLLSEMPPFHGGGEMIKEVTFEKTTYNDLPFKFEAGTPNIAGAIGLSAAIDYVSTIGYDGIHRHEQQLLNHATEALRKIDGLQIIGTSDHKASVTSFIVDGVHTYDIGTLLDQMGIAVRTGHHCCQPLMNELGIEGTCRASFSMYNTLEEVQLLGDKLSRAVKILRK